MRLHPIINKLFILAVILLVMTAPLSARADGSGMVEPIYDTAGQLYPVLDYADLLSDDEEQKLAEQIWTIEDAYSSAIVILTVNSTGNRSATEYADDFYDYNGYGFGENHDGIIFLVSMEDRSWHISTTGSAIRTFTDSDIEYISDRCLSDLSSGYYYDAFSTYVRLCGNELEKAYNDAQFTLFKFLICLLIGAVLALIPLAGFMLQLKTVKPAKGAGNYSPDGLKLKRNSDIFIRSSISKTRIPKDSGGSSTHTGSSGTSHGGGGGHF